MCNLDQGTADRSWRASTARQQARELHVDMSIGRSCAGCAHLEIRVADLADDLLRHLTSGVHADEAQVGAAGRHNQATLQQVSQPHTSGKCMPAGGLALLAGFT